MNAPDYLKVNQRFYKLADELLVFVPKDRKGGGTDLHDLPLELREQASVAFGLPTEEITFWQIMAHVAANEDWAKNLLDIMQRDFPEDLRGPLRLGNDLAIGTIQSGEVNGTVLRTPDRKGKVVMLTQGAMLFLFNVGSQLSMLASEDLRNVVLSGHDDKIRSRRTLVERNLITHAFFNDAKFRSRYPVKRAANELSAFFNRYHILGVADPVELIREYGPLPLHGDPRRIGHPLESAAAIEFISETFLLLHELAHVLLDHSHDEMAGREDAWHKEFEADHYAMEVAMKSSLTEDTKIAAWIGAWVFLESVAWLEGLDRLNKIGSPTTHPPAKKRMDHLRKRLSEGVYPISEKTISGHIHEVESLFEECWHLTEWSRQNNFENENPLTWLIDESIRQNTTHMFEDQIPRWLLFGAPEKVCVQLAKHRAKFEDLIGSNNERELNEKKLNLVMWVYERTSELQKGYLASELTRAYDEVRTNESTDRTRDN